MTFAETVVLGALAGFTIYVGLPFGRLQLLSERMRVGLAMFSVGVLAFLFVDVFEHAFAIVEECGRAASRTASRASASALGFALLLGAGFAAGTAGLAMVERWMRPRGAGPPADRRRLDRRDDGRAGGGVSAATRAARARALRTGMTIAVAIGLHNFAEGLAIGVSAAPARSASRPC